MDTSIYPPMQPTSCHAMQVEYEVAKIPCLHHEYNITADNADITDIQTKDCHHKPM